MLMHDMKPQWFSFTTESIYCLLCSPAKHGTLQAYAVGPDSSQCRAARQELQTQLQSPEGATVPVCLVCERVSEDSAPSEDYHQFGFGDISLQVWLLGVAYICH